MTAEVKATGLLSLRFYRTGYIWYWNDGRFLSWNSMKINRSLIYLFVKFGQPWERCVQTVYYQLENKVLSFCQRSFKSSD